MLDMLKINGYTVTVEGTWYEVANGVEVVEYGNVEAGTTPTQLYEWLKAKGVLSRETT